MLNIFKRPLSNESKSSETTPQKKNKLEKQKAVSTEVGDIEDRKLKRKSNSKTKDSKDENPTDSSTTDSSSESDTGSSSEYSDSEDDESTPALPKLPDNTPEWGKALLEIMNSNFRKLDQKSNKIGKKCKAIKTISDKCAQLELKNTQLLDENTELREKMLDLEYRQRRHNLVFDGIPESREESGYSFYMKIMRVCSGIPGIQADTGVDRCHRLGEFNKYYNRPIICCFTYYSDVTHILSNRKNLPQDVYVNEELPDEWKDRRRILRPLYNAAVKNTDLKGKVKWSKDKLIVDGKVVMAAPINNIADMSKHIDIAGTCEKKSTEVILFQGIHSVYSNLHPVSFKVDNCTYNSAEQFYQASKAACFNDDVSHRKIMITKNPYKIKRLGNRVKGYADQQWKQKMRECMYTCVKAKFAQNPALTDLLKSTGSVKIVEATLDTTWGCGTVLKTMDILKHPEHWQNPGLMCEILCRIRSEL